MINEQDKYNAMLALLDEFKYEKHDLRRMREEKDLEQSTMNRLLKNEIIDISERLERMESVMEKVCDTLDELKAASQKTKATSRSALDQDSSMYFSANEAPLDKNEEQNYTPARQVEGPDNYGHFSDVAKDMMDLLLTNKRNPYYQSQFRNRFKPK